MKFEIILPIENGLFFEKKIQIGKSKSWLQTAGDLDFMLTDPKVCYIFGS